MMVLSMAVLIWFIATLQATSDVSDAIEFMLPFEEAAVFHDDYLSQAKYIYKLYCKQSCHSANNNFNNRYCNYCFCDSACRYYGDCCPDYPYNNNSYLGSHSCLPTQFPFPDRFFKIVGSCPENHEDKKMVERCKKTSVYNWKSIQPVSDHSTGLTYKNRYCADCNGVKSSRIVPWNIGARCVGGPLELDGFDNKQQIYMSILSTEYCKIVFVKPDGISYRPCKPTDTIPPKQCNLTGLSLMHDPLVERGCLTFPENVVRSYPNVFCYICNTYLTWQEIKENILGHDPNVFRVALSALLDLDGSDDYEDDTTVNTSESCPFTDPYTCECRNISCVEGKKFEDRQCVSLFKMTKTYRYNACFNVQLNFNSSVKSPNETFLGTFVQNMASLEATFDCDLYTDYLSECGFNMTLKVIMKCTLYFRQPVYTDVFEEAIFFMTKNKLNLTDDYLGIEIHLAGECKSVSGAVYINYDLTVPCPNYSTAKIRITQYNATVDRNMKIQTKSLILSKTFLCPKITLTTNEVVVSPSNDSLLIVATNETVKAFEVASDEESKYLVCLDDYLHAQIDWVNCDIDPAHSSIMQKYSTLGIVSGVCTCISVIFLAITLVIFCCIKTLRTTIGIGIIALTASLIIAQLLFEFGAEQTEISWVCQALGILTHFFWLASTFWMNVCTLILFYKLNFPVESRNLSTKRLLIASNSYCWGSSGLIMAILVLSSYYTDNSFGYGGASCYITSINGRRYGFALPVGLLVLINILLFFSTFIKLKMNEKLQSNQESQISMLGCLKLSVITGLTWSFAFVFEATGNVVFAYLFTIFVGSQGVVIFLAFVGNKRVFGMLKEGFKASSEHNMQYKKESSNVENRKKSPNFKSYPETEEFEDKKKFDRSDVSVRDEQSSEDVTHAVI